MCSCLHEKQKNKWKLAGRDLHSERKVSAEWGFTFWGGKTAILGE